MPFAELTPAIAAAALARVGLELVPAELRIEAREQRWLVHLPGQRLAWFAMTEQGRRSLVTERRVLRLLEARCGFHAPRVVLEDPADDFDVRTMVPGVSDPWGVFAAACASPPLAARIGASVGAILAEQHARIAAADVAGWLPTRPTWPEPAAWIRERLVQVTDDGKLIADAEAIIARYEALPIAKDERALVHTDVGFHNLGIDPITREVQGIFDYEAAAWADRHHDFRYLVFDHERYDLLDAARAVYEPTVGRTIDRGRLLLYNAACAIAFLAFRAGSAPGDRPCGRTLPEDLRWSRNAIGLVLDHD